jgi:DNA-binding NtrC family response regulator
MNDFRVLFVDDEVDFLDTLLKRMRKRRVNVSGVKSGEDALEWLSGNIADVVVLDVRMPGMDGIETLRAIKKLNPLVEIIMLTGHANLEVARKGMELGAFDYLMKPIDIDELLYKVQDACKKKSIHEQKIKNINHLIDSDR